jgi:SPOR domain
MADNDFRAYRSRDAVARDDIDAHAPDSVRDPLAELARLIGQADPASEYDRNPGHEPEPALQYEEAAPVAPSQNWVADETYEDQPQYAEQGYEQPAEPHPALPDYPSYQGNPPQPQFDDRYFDPAGSRDPAPRREAVSNDRYADDELPPLPRGRQLPALAPQQSYEDEYQDEGQWQDEQGEQGEDAYDTDEHGRPYAGDEYQEEAERAPRRSGLALVLGVVGLVTIGAASALAYRTMFGDALIPSLPPIIKASDGPNKIVPAQAANSGSAAASSANSAEKLVPREEQPVPIQPQNAPPRVVATIPVAPQQGSAVVGAQSLGPVTQSAPVQSAFPPPPGAAASPAPAPTTNPTEPKKVHTVLIRPEQSGSAAPAAQAPAAHSNAPTSLSPHAAPVPHSVPPSSPNAPLALVPTAQGNTPHVVAPRAQVARAEPGAGAPLATAPAAVSPGTAAGGGYSVQVTSQRSETEAQTSYRELQAKYPAQLGSHHATIHRADLGDKGTYYRALIGPYSSAEGAAGMCSSLKAAGGSCIVQKN